MRCLRDKFWRSCQKHLQPCGNVGFETCAYMTNAWNIQCILVNSYFHSFCSRWALLLELAEKEPKKPQYACLLKEAIQMLAVTLSPQNAKQSNESTNLWKRTEGSVDDGLPSVRRGKETYVFRKQTPKPNQKTNKRQTETQQTIKQQNRNNQQQHKELNYKKKTETPHRSQQNSVPHHTSFVA